MVHRTDWLHAARYGVFTHYLTAPETTAEAWDQQVSAVDVRRLAAQIASTGAGYAMFTIGQNSGHFCAPNAAYDGFVGRSPSKLSRRDLIADLAPALAAHGVRLMVYLPSGAPAADPVARERLGWEWGYEGDWPGGWGTVREGLRLAAFQEKWEAVIREWSLRWGAQVSGWWFDGCYFADQMYRFPDPPSFASLAAASRAGNPDSLVAFNPGVLDPVVVHAAEEDYTAGEINEPEVVDCPGRFLAGKQVQILTYLGPTWGQGPPRFTPEQVLAITRRLVDCGGVVTWDVPITPAGVIPDEFVDRLQSLQALR